MEPLDTTKDFFSIEPCFRKDHPFRQSAEPWEEAAQRRAVAADGAGAAAAEAGQRETPGGSSQHQRRPCSVKREGELKILANSIPRGKN